MHSGYGEIQDPPQRYAVIDQQELIELCGFAGARDFQHAHRQWVKKALENELAARDARWSEALAFGSLAFVKKVKSELGIKAVHRAIEDAGVTPYCGNEVELTEPNLPVKITR